MAYAKSIKIFYIYFNIIKDIYLYIAMLAYVSIQMQPPLPFKSFIIFS